MSQKKSETEKVGNVAPFGLRMLPTLKDQIAAAADQNGRSMNAEIVTRLEASLIGAGGGGDAIDQVFVNTMAKLTGEDGALDGEYLHRLTAEYADYKQLQIHKLRDFLDLVQDLVREASGKEKLSMEEETQRSVENELARVRSWANAWGYDVVKSSKAKSP